MGKTRPKLFFSRVLCRANIEPGNHDTKVRSLVKSICCASSFRTSQKAVMDLMSDFKPFQDRVTTSLLNVTRTAGQLSAEDLSFHRSSNGSFSRSLDAQNSRLLQLTQKLLRAATTTGTNISPPKVKYSEDVDDNWRGLVDVVDDLLERADACLDEYTGVIKRLSPAAQDGSMTPTSAKESRSKNFPSIFSARQLAKPQLLFEKAHTNHETAPFKPLLRTKPHSIVELEESIGDGKIDGQVHLNFHRHVLN
jgi:exosome complex exonuclease RRP6